MDIQSSRPSEVTCSTLPIERDPSAPQWEIGPQHLFQVGVGAGSGRLLPLASIPPVNVMSSPQMSPRLFLLQRPCPGAGSGLLSTDNAEQFTMTMVELPMPGAAGIFEAKNALMAALVVVPPSTALP